MKDLKAYIKEFLIKENNKPPEDFEQGLNVKDEKGKIYKIVEPDGPGPTTVVSQNGGDNKIIPSKELKIVKDNDNAKS